MAKKIVLDALQRVLSDYLEIDETNFDLNLAVWSGSIKLHDVKLKTDKLFRSFNTTFVHGSVKTLEIFIPWTALLNSPVRIKIDGVYLQLRPLNVSSLSKEERQDRVRSQKQEKIQFADKFLKFHHDHDDDDNSDSDSDYDSDGEKVDKAHKKAKDKSWIESWTSKVVDNLEISLENVHARYEDSQTNPGRTYSAGVILSHFVLATCDQNWETTFVARVHEAIHKMCRVENFGVYWNMDSESLASLPFDEWEKAMQGIIYHGNNDGVEETSAQFLDEQAKRQASRTGAKKISSYSPYAMKFILAPTNKLVVKVVHNEVITSSPKSGEIPKYDVSVVNEQVSLALDGLQYKQLNQTLEMIGTVERRRQSFMYKPVTRPVDKESIKAWWKYSLKLVLKRKRYIQLVELQKTADPHDPFKDSLSYKEREEMEELEERLPLHCIITFRHMAADVMEINAANAKKERIKQAQKNQSKQDLTAVNYSVGGAVTRDRTWMEFLTFKPKPGEKSFEESLGIDDKDIGISWDEAIGEEELDESSADKVKSQDDIQIKDIISELEKHRKHQIEKHATHKIFAKVNVRTSATLELSQYGVPVLSASMACTAVSETTTSGTHLELGLSDMIARDRITPNPPLPNLISVKPADGKAEAVTDVDLSGKATFTVVFDSHDGKKVLRISSLPLQVCLRFRYEGVMGNITLYWWCLVSCGVVHQTALSFFYHIIKCS